MNLQVRWSFSLPIPWKPGWSSSCKCTQEFLNHLETNDWKIRGGFVKSTDPSIYHLLIPSSYNASNHSILVWGPGYFRWYGLSQILKIIFCIELAKDNWKWKHKTFWSCNKCQTIRLRLIVVGRKEIAIFDGLRLATQRQQVHLNAPTASRLKRLMEIAQDLSFHWAAKCTVAVRSLDLAGAIYRFAGVGDKNRTLFIDILKWILKNTDKVMKMAKSIWKSST